MKANLLIAICVIFSYLVLTIDADEASGECTIDVHRHLVFQCQLSLIGKLQTDLRLQNDCKTLYLEERKECTENVIKRCFEFSDDDATERQKKEEAEKANFGSQELYCKYGGIKPMAPIIAKISDEENNCKTTANNLKLVAKEEKFYDQFQDARLDSTVMCKLAVELLDCHQAINLACKVNTSDYKISDVARTHLLATAYCKSPETNRKSLEVPPGEIEVQHHPTVFDFFMPVLVVSILILICLLIGLCYLGRRELERKRREKKQKKESEKEKEKDKAKNSYADEPKPESEEMVPLTTIVTQENERFQQSDIIISD